MTRERSGLARVGGIALLAVAASWLTACGYTDMHEVILREPSGPAAHDPEIYVMGQDPGRPVWEIALLQAIGHGSDADLEDTTAALRARARQLGCDAVVKVRYDQGYSMSQAVGVCVRWAKVVAEPPREAAPPPTLPSSTPPAPPPAAGSTI